MEQRRDPRPESPSTPRATSEPACGESSGLTAVESERRSRLEILIELLADDSPSVLAGVRRKLEALGRPALPALRRAARRPHARVRVQARRIAGTIERQRVLRRLLGYALREDIDLERGLYLLARLERPDFDCRPYRKALDAMGAAVRERVARAEDGVAAPMALPQYLGNELGFVGSELDFHHPDNIHLHRALERKRGMPLTLVAIYLLVARRARLRAAPIALPGRVLLRLYTGPRSLILDPFQGGRARTRADCVRYLAKHGLVPRPNWFADASDVALFQRQILNLMASYQERRLKREARELQRIVAAMNRARTARAKAGRSGR